MAAADAATDGAAADGAAGEERCPRLVLQDLKMSFECGICMEDGTDPVTLPCCRQWMCRRCLEKIFDKQSQGQDGPPKCSYCREPLTKTPDQYPTNRLIQHFQGYGQSPEGDNGERCQIQDCDRRVDKLCRGCKMFLCYRCSDLDQCNGKEEAHDTVKITDCVAESREIFSLWEGAKQKAIQDLKIRKEKARRNIRAYTEQLASADDESLDQLTTQLMPQLTAAHQELLAVKEKTAEEESQLRFAISQLESVNETRLIYFVRQLHVYEQTKRIILGDYEVMIIDKQCWDISWCKTGHLLVATEGGLDVLQVSDGQLLQHVESAVNHTYTVEPYKDIIVVGAAMDNPLRHQIIIYDTEYKEIRRWSVPIGCDVTVADDKIFRACGSGSDDIKVYSLEGESLPGLLWNGDLCCIANSLPCSIIFGDDRQHCIYKQEITVGRKRIIWSAEIKVPRCLCVDDNGSIWVRSNSNDCLTIFSRQGVKIQEIMDPKLTKLLIIINDLCIYKDHLYVAHEQGVGRFPIAYQ